MKAIVLGKDGRTRLEAGMEMLDGMGAIIEAPGENTLPADR